jgi:Mrp family chromosome partitioning ATPase
MMGRLLEALKRRDTNGVSHHDASAPTAPAAEVVDDWSLGGDEVPFIEVPGAMSPSVAAIPIAPPAPLITATAAEVAFAPAKSQADAAAHGLESAARAEIARQYLPACRALWDHLRSEGVRSLVLQPLGLDADLAMPILRLARGLLDAGCRRLLLIDTDPLTPTLSRSLQRSETPGWSDLLAGLKPTQVIQESGWYELHVICAGSPLARHALTELRRAEKVIGDLGKDYDLVLLLSPTWSATGLPSLLIHAVGGTLLLTARGVAALEATSQLQRQQVRVVGSLALDV